MNGPKNYHIYVTAAIMAAMEKSEATKKAIHEGVDRFNAGEWGNIRPEDKAANNAEYEAHSGRIVARYPSPQGDFYIILEMMGDAGGADRATIMFREEY